MTKTLADFGIKEKSGGQYKTLCPQCSHKRRNKTEECLSVNAVDGVWHCHHCGWVGSLKNGSSFSSTQNGEFKQPMRPSVKPEVGSDLPDKVVAWFAARGISKATLEAERIFTKNRYVPAAGEDRLVIGFPFLKAGNPVNIKYRDRDKNFSLEAGCEICMFRHDKVVNRRLIALTEGEMDALSLVECGFQPVASVPNGARENDKLEWLNEVLPMLEQAKEILLVTDKDEVGVAYEELLAEKLGTYRCRRVDYPEDCKDINDVLKKHGKEKVRECLANAVHFPVHGVSTFVEFGDEIAAYYKDGAKQAFSTGWASLDRLIRLQPGSLNVLTGIPGSGKTEMLDGLIINTMRDHNWRWAVYSPENAPAPFHFQKLAEKLIGKPMFGHDRMTLEEVETAKRSLSDSVKLIMPEENCLSIDQVLLKAKVCHYRYHVNALVVDPYNELEHMRPAYKSETEYISEFLTKVRYFGRINNIIVFIVAHPTKLVKNDNGEYPVPDPYSISGSAAWRNKADCCWAVWRSFTKKENKLTVHVQKVRNKNMGTPGSVTFDWDWHTGRLSEIAETEKPSNLPYRD